MKIKLIFNIFILIIIVVGVIGITRYNTEPREENIHNLTATIIKVENDKFTVQDNKNIIYTFNISDTNINKGDKINLKYKGKLNKNKDSQAVEIIEYEKGTEKTDEGGVPLEWKDNGIFRKFYILANEKIKKMSLNEKIAQILLVRYPEENAKEILSNYQFGGYIFFAKDFKDKTKEEVIDMIKNLQNVAKIPILTAVDEEGGIVVRVSSNKNIRNEPFKSPRQLYLAGGMDRIKEDVKEKSTILSELGINLNLAPVVDVSTNPNDYMYQRALGENTQITSKYAKIVIEESKKFDVSYTLKHFPGYGNNEDTHTKTSVDNRTYEDIIKNDLPPFQSGIKAKAEAILVSHNTVNSIDKNNPASLSPDIHNLLRNKLKFTGIIITDDLAMGAIDNVEAATVKAILAGNDLIITTDYEKSFNAIKKAIDNKTIDESLINKLAFRIIAWKYYKGLMMDTKK